MSNSFHALAAEVSVRTAGVYRGPDAGKKFSRVAQEVRDSFGPQVADGPPERDSEWQRVNSYIADVLKDAHVLYSKLARLQGDFVGPELTELESISSKVLDLGEELSQFMKAFHEGEASMMKEKQFGGPDSGGGAPPGTPPPQIPSEFKRPEEDFETELDLEGDGDFEDYEGDKKDEEEEESQEQQ
jgi:hypothetical protein